MPKCFLGIDDCYSCTLYAICKLPPHAVVPGESMNRSMDESYLGQHLRSYEQTRYTFIERFLPTITVQPDAETFADLSFYQPHTNFDTYATHARAVILRIGQNVWKDTEFETAYAAARARRLAIGGYYFFDGRASPQAQADTLIRAMSGKYLDMELFIDWERVYGGAYEGLPNVVKLMQLVESAGVKCKAVGIYTGYYFFVEHSNATANGAQYTYIKSRPLWLGWYAAAALVRVPFPWDNWTHWQYGTPAVSWGQPTAEIDLNRHNGTKTQFEQRYISVVNPIQDVTTVLFPGVTQVSGTRLGWKFWIHIIDPAPGRYEVVNVAGLATVSSIAKALNAPLAWNGSDYDRTTYALHKGNPSFYRSGDVRNDSNGDVYGVRPLIVDGVISPRLYEADAAAQEGHSRTCFGKTADGKIIHLVSEGVYPNQGMRLVTCAEIMKQYGAVLAGDAGGGGDTTLYVNGVVLNVTENIYNGSHFERPIPQVLLAYPTGASTETGVTMYQGVTNSLAKVWDRIGGRDIKQLPSGTTVKGEAIRADGYVLLASPVVGYVQASRINGYHEVGTVTLPPSGPTVTHTIKVYSDGKVSIDGGTPA